MSSARTAMLDLYVEPSVLSDCSRRDDIISTVETLFDTLSLKRKYEQMIEGSLVVMYAVEDASITALLRTYPFGLITITFEECLKVSPFTNPKLEEFRKILNKRLDIRVEKVPVVKRGPKVPVYFTSSDERLLEYDFNKVLYETNSEFQNIKILQSPTIGNCLFLDDFQNLGEKDVSYTHGLMKKPILSYCDKEILILGGGDGGLLYELLKEKPRHVTMVDIDRLVIESCRVHLRGACGDALDELKGKNHEVIIDDCIKKLEEYKTEGRKFDFVFNDLTDIPIATSPQGELWTFVKKIVSMSLAVLGKDGHYLNHAIGEICTDAMKTYEDMLSDMSVKLNFQKHSAYVPSFMETWVFYDITFAE